MGEPRYDEQLKAARRLCPAVVRRLEDLEEKVEAERAPRDPSGPDWVDDARVECAMFALECFHRELGEALEALYDGAL